MTAADLDAARRMAIDTAARDAAYLDERAERELDRAARDGEYLDELGRQRQARENTEGHGGGEGWRAEVERLAKLFPIEYDRVRIAEAEALGVRVTTLDAEVEKERMSIDSAGKADIQGEPVLFAEIEPWPDPVDGILLIGELVFTCRRYLTLPEHTDTLIALWIVFTHAIESMNVAPILAITSPEKRCGKTTLITLLGRLARQPLPSSNITAASLFRVIEACAPSLLIDEADTFLRGSDELRGVINSGHTRDTSYVIRTVGDDHEPRRFSTWGAKAIALIGKLKDPLADRSIEIPLRRKLPGEPVEKLRHADLDVFRGLSRRCARFAKDHAVALRMARPSMPAGLHDRAADNWEPLLAIAEAVGGDWPELARKAAVALSGAEDAEDGSLRARLLVDIRSIFMSKRGCDRLPTVELIEALLAMDEAPWGEANRSKPINPRWLAAQLRPFGIVRGTKRAGDSTYKGYALAQFTDAFARYLPPVPSESPPSDRSRGHNVDVARVSEDFASVTRPTCDRNENALKPNAGAGCDRVTDDKGESWEMLV